VLIDQHRIIGAQFTKVAGCVIVGHLVELVASAEKVARLGTECLASRSGSRWHSLNCVLHGRTVLKRERARLDHFFFCGKNEIKGQVFNEF